MKMCVISMVFLVCVTMTARGQGPGGNQGGNQGGNAGGILISPAGVVSSVTQGLSPSALEARQKAFDGAIGEDLKRPSDKRFVSLVQLSQEVNSALREGRAISPELFYLAGLTRIDEIFLDEALGELVIAGPAGAFRPDRENRVVNSDSGRACLRLDDLVESLASVAKRAPVVCSIDPVDERVAALMEYIRTNSSLANMAIVKQRYQRMGRVLGEQNVRLENVHPQSHLAVTLLEADYRMKKVSLGLEKPRVEGFRSHLSLLKPQGNSMQRWYFLPLYDSIRTDETHRSFELKGPRLQLVSQEEIVASDGQRSDAAVTRQSTQAWAMLFTKKMEELATAMPVFSELQNIVDLLTLGALMKTYQLDQRAGWNSFEAEKLRQSFPAFVVPKTVETLVNTQQASGGMILGLIAGGVKVDPRQVVRLVEVESKPTRVQTGMSVPQANLNGKPRWWWDGE